MNRPIPHADRAPRSAADLVAARRAGRISRRDLIRRAVGLGLSAPVIGALLHCTSDAAFGAVRPESSDGRRLAQQSDPTPVKAATKPSGTPVSGGSLVCGTSHDIDTLHPYIAQTLAGLDLISGLFDGLLAYDSGQQLQPALAEDFKISDDGLTYTFTLREGVTFHNGDKFTGQDVIDSWKMIMNPDFGALNTLGWDKIKDITVKNTTLTITTKEVYAPFISYVGTTPICPRAEVGKGPDAFRRTFGQAPIGTGPLTFVEWVPRDRVTLKRNDDYWGNRPKLDEVVCRIFPDDPTLLSHLSAGDVQLAGSSGALGALRVDAALSLDQVTVLEHETQAWAHLDLKQVDFLRITKVRQALDLATPAERIVKDLLAGHATRAVADIAPINWAYNPNITPRPYDLDEARRLLREAGLTPGDDGVLTGKIPDPEAKDPNAPPTGPVRPFEMQLWAIAGDVQAQQIVEVIAQSWNAIGIKTTTKFAPTSELWGPEGYQFTDRMTACLYSWYNANDPDDMFYWHSSQIPTSPTASGGNLPAFFHPYSFQKRIDDLTQRAAAEMDLEARKKLYWQIQELLHEEVPVIFLYWSKAFPVVADGVGGFWPSAFTYLLWNVEDWYLTTAAATPVATGG